VLPRPLIYSDGSYDEQTVAAKKMEKEKEDSPTGSPILDGCLGFFAELGKGVLKGLDNH